MRLPGGYEGDDDLDDEVVTPRGVTVVTHPDDWVWLRQTLQLRSGGRHPGSDPVMSGSVGAP